MANVALSLVVPVEVRDALRTLAASSPVPVKPATLAAHLLGVAVTCPDGVTPERLAWARLALAAGEDDKEGANAAAKELAAMGVPVAELRKRARS